MSEMGAVLFFRSACILLFRRLPDIVIRRVGIVGRLAEIGSPKQASVKIQTVYIIVSSGLQLLFAPGLQP